MYHSPTPLNAASEYASREEQPAFHDVDLPDATAPVSADHGLLERRYAIARHYNEHGVCVFDKHQRLVLSNDQYARIYGLEPSDVKVGMSLREILALRIKKGIYGSNGAAAYEREWLRTVTRRKTRIQDLIDGRCILVVQQPTTNGHWITTHEDITERLKSEAQVTFLATRDSLTGLSNRVALMARLNEKLAKLSGEDKTCVILFDLDHFKPVNDTYGHDVGDEVLKIAAARIRCHARDTDTVARLGGDEFVVVQSPVLDNARLAERANEFVEALATPFETTIGPVSISASIGVAITGTSKTTAEAILKSADLALYQAKESGRSTCHVNELGCTSGSNVSRTKTQPPGNTMNHSVSHKKTDMAFGQRDRQLPQSTRPSMTSTTLKGNAGDERRLDERIPTNFRANIFCHDRYQTIVVKNVSCGGVMIANAFGLAIGDVVIVTTLKGRCYQGRVAWTVSPYTGIKFDSRIGPNDPLFNTSRNL